MKKLIFYVMGLIAMCAVFEACSSSKTYAEKLEDEQDAIDEFIADQGITVIQQSDFHAKDSTTDVSKNEFVKLASGVYMQIVSKGVEDKSDTVKANDIVLVRFTQIGLETKDTISNVGSPSTVDVFKYTVSSSTIAGSFTEGYMLSNYGSTVPAGWLVAFPYIRNMAHVRLIVPSKMGHTTAQSYVYPYYYDLAKIQIYK